MFMVSALLSILLHFVSELLRVFSDSNYDLRHRIQHRSVHNALRGTTIKHFYKRALVTGYLKEKQPIMSDLFSAPGVVFTVTPALLSFP